MEGGVKKMTKEELKQKNKWFLKGGRGSGKTIRALYKFYGNRIEELEAQIEKMKCCDNCKHNRPVVTVNKTIKLSGELDYAIRYDVEHDLFHAQNVFSDEYITPTFVTYVQKLEQDLSNKKLAIQNRKADIERLENENAELKEKISYLKDNLRVARKDRENLQLDVAKGLKEFVKDFPATAIRYMADEKYVEQLTKAKELLNEFMRISKASDEDFEHDYSELVREAEQFLKEVEI